MSSFIDVDESKLSIDSKPLASLARRVAKPRRTGNTEADLQLKMQYTSLVRCVDWLVKHPNQITGVWNLMQTHNFDAHVAQQSSSSEWTGNYKILAKIPQAWMAQFLMSRYDELTKDNLNKLLGIDADAITTLFLLEVQLQGTFIFPAACKDKTIASKVFNSRADDCNRRVGVLLKAGGLNLTTGALNMGKGGCFTLEFSEELTCISVTHTATQAKATLPKHIVITTEFKMVDNYIDHLARVELGYTTHYLWSLFPAESDFLKKMIKELPSCVN